MSIVRSLCLYAAFLTVTGSPLALRAAVVESGPVQLVTPFTISASTQVPGKTLKAGTYSIRVVDHLSDRVILQIEDAKGNAQTRFLGLENSTLHASSRTTGPLPWANGANKTTALRGFSFPGGTTVEFVYPKEDAVLIAKVNADKVPAIDPASEGKVAANHLSKDDLQTVTLWSLSPTRVGADDAIEATRYQAPAQLVSTPRRAETVSAPRGDASKPYQAVAAPSTRRARSSAPAQIATVRSAPLQALPHTAGIEPLVALIGLVALGGGFILRATRRAGHAA